MISLDSIASAPKDVCERKPNIGPQYYKLKLLSSRS